MQIAADIGDAPKRETAQPDPRRISAQQQAEAQPASTPIHPSPNQKKKNGFATAGRPAQYRDGSGHR